MDKIHIDIWKKVLINDGWVETVYIPNANSENGILQLSKVNKTKSSKNQLTQVALLYFNRDKLTVDEIFSENKHDSNIRKKKNKTYTLSSYSNEYLYLKYKDLILKEVRNSKLNSLLLI